MESFLEEGKKDKRSYTGYLAGAVVGIVLIGGAVAFMLTRPPAEDQRAQILQGSVREGSPEFAAYTKDIIISTDYDKTVESPTGLGTISMFIVGKIRNRGEKTFTVLEVNASVIDQQNKVLKEKNILVVPERTADLTPGETAPVTLALEGFDPKADRANIRWKVSALKVAD